MSIVSVDVDDPQRRPYGGLLRLNIEQKLLKEAALKTALLGHIYSISTTNGEKGEAHQSTLRGSRIPIVSLDVDDPKRRTFGRLRLKEEQNALKEAKVTTGRFFFVVWSLLQVKHTNLLYRRGGLRRKQTSSMTLRRRKALRETSLVAPLIR
jgi:hypothetical protein